MSNRLEIYGRTNPVPTMVAVNSSHVQAIGYLDGDLFVEYTNGLYKYKAVPEFVFSELLAANSKGNYINAYIRDKYDYDYLI